MYMDIFDNALVLASHLHMNSLIEFQNAHLKYLDLKNYFQGAKAPVTMEFLFFILILRIHQNG